LVPEFAAALALIYACGYVGGALLVVPADDRASLPLAMVRLLAGLHLASIAFLLCLVLSIPVWTGLIAPIALALVAHRGAALMPPRMPLRITRGGIAAALLIVVVMAPAIIATVSMGAGEDFPPVFFNVDNAYFLEKVHAVGRSDTYPPGSLGVLDGRFLYHYGVHGIAAFIARGSGLAAHHVLFLLVTPLLVCGIVAAALLLAREVAPSIPRVVTVPMLLIAVPTLWYSFWQDLGPAFAEAASARSVTPLVPFATNHQFWGVFTSTAQNLDTHFLVLAVIGAFVAAPARGWRLAVFLAGSAVIFKAPTGVALASGFCLAQAARAAAGRSLRPLVPAVATAAVFGAVYGAFWIAPDSPPTYRTELFPFFHLGALAHDGNVGAFVADLAWLLLPALLVLPVRSGEVRGQGLALVMFAVAPLVLVNALRSEDLRPGRGVDNDWFQVLLPLPLIVRALVVHVAGQRWAHLGAGLRSAFVAAAGVALVPSVIAAAYYSRLLIVNPEDGYEYVDNRALGRALAMIPRDGTLVVTNDLRYPANGFFRTNRQMQIPALFGHQAFAVNYAYEAYAFSEQRMELQSLLQSEKWDEAIERAARRHGWTHLLIRKDYVHPAPVPLEHVFESTLYSVYRFPGVTQ
jgi:hypothetical protein